MENDLQRPLRIFWFYYLLLLVNTTPKIDYQFITAFFLIYIIYISRIFSRSKSVGDVAKNWMYLFLWFFKAIMSFPKKMQTLENECFHNLRWISKSIWATWTCHISFSLWKQIVLNIRNAVLLLEWWVLRKKQKICKLFLKHALLLHLFEHHSLTLNQIYWNASMV